MTEIQAPQSEQVALDVGMNSLEPKTTPTLRRAVFYGDPGADKVVQKLDKVASDITDALYDPNHVFHKTIPKHEFVKVFCRVIEHMEFRAKLDWAKEQYYEIGSGSNNNNMINQTVVNVSGSDRGFAEEKVVEFK